MTSETQSSMDQAEFKHENLGPTTESTRIQSLDLLRGFALLGILVPNIQAFSMVSMAYRNPTAYGDFEGANYLVWYLTNLLFEQKFMTIFSVLFGAGIILMTSRVKEAGRSQAAMHYRRMFWLLVIGLVHAHLIWFGDILVSYALSAMIVFWLRNLRARWLLIIGFLLIGFGSCVSLFFGWSMQFWPAEAVEEMRLEWQPSQEVVDKELDAYRGGWLGQLPLRSTTAFFFETFMFGFWIFWRAGGLMLIGMALFKLGVLSAAKSDRFYKTGALVGLTVGLPLVVVENWLNQSRDFEMEFSFFFGNQINYWASLFVSFGYVSTLMLIFRKQLFAWLQHSLASVGRMALSNYLSQSILCTSFFYGHGLGYFGHLERSEQLMVVVSIWIAQLIWSPLWLKYFKFGPFEWLWRSLVYWSRQPMRRT